MPKVSVFIILFFCLVVYSGFAFDLFYSHSVYNFESCLAYGAVSTSTKGECSDKDGKVFYSDDHKYVSAPDLFQEATTTTEVSVTATSSVE